MLGEIGPTQCPPGAALASPGRRALALLQRCPCSIARTALSSPSHERRLLCSVPPRPASPRRGRLLTPGTQPQRWELSCCRHLHSQTRGSVRSDLPLGRKTPAQHKPSDCFVQSKKKQTFYFLINILQPSNTPSNYSFYMSLSLMTS